MEHTPTQTEQEAIDLLLEQFVFEPVTFRLTKTMLEKGIIDAGQDFRYLLGKTGLVEYTAIPPSGAENGVKLAIRVGGKAGLESRTVSFYRPKTKQGDPRFWIYGLAEIAEPGDLLVGAFTRDNLAFLVLTAATEVLAETLSTFAPPRDSGFTKAVTAVDRVANVLRTNLQRWIPTVRAGDTGVGLTLEHLLGITANVRQDADLDGVELKAHRAGKGDPLITLFSKTPRWGTVGKTKDLVLRYGYRDEAKDRQALYCSVAVQQNRLGWRLQLDASLGRVDVCYGGTPVVYYTLETLEHRLFQKHSHTLFVAARARGSGAGEEFLFEKATYCREPSIAAFMKLLEAGEICLDFVAHVKNGKAKDHGYLWRIRESQIPELYAYKRELL